MALRLKYAGAKNTEIHVAADVQSAINFEINYISERESRSSDSGKEKSQIKNSLNILPTYTALLDLEKKLSLTTSPLEISPHLHH
jgi:hypothetical protein